MQGALGVFFISTLRKAIMLGVWQRGSMVLVAVLVLATVVLGGRAAAETPAEPPAAKPQVTVAAEQAGDQTADPPAAEATSKTADKKTDKAANKAAGAVDKAAAAWRPLTIAAGGKWVACRFGGDGAVEIKDGVISLGFGDPLTGVRWEGEFPRQDYEISLEARRIGGFDFFCGLTLPSDEQRFSLILGGWGGSLVGISSIDGMDASENETTVFDDFKENRWYKVRVAVTKERLRAWLDDEDLVDVQLNGRPLDIRGEMEEATPVGIAAFQCTSEIRNVRVRALTKPVAGSREQGDGDG